MTRRSFKAKVRIPDRSWANGERAHLDLWGPYGTPSYAGSRYFVVIVDEASRFTSLFLLTKRSEIYDIVEHYRLRIEAQTDQRLRSLNMDNAKELLALKARLEHDHHLECTLTITKTPAQNGIAERMIRTITERIRCLLLAGGFPPQLWGEAALTAAYCVNLVPSRARNMISPYELWFGRVPKLHHLRVFGCVAYAFIDKDERRKLEARARLTAFVGYPSDRRGYRLVDVSTLEIIYSHTVKFEEWHYATLVSPADARRNRLRRSPGPSACSTPSIVPSFSDHALAPVQTMNLYQYPLPRLAPVLASGGASQHGQELASGDILEESEPHNQRYPRDDNLAALHGGSGSIERESTTGEANQRNPRELTTSEANERISKEPTTGGAHDIMNEATDARTERVQSNSEANDSIRRLNHELPNDPNDSSQVRRCRRDATQPCNVPQELCASMDQESQELYRNRVPQEPCVASQESQELYRKRVPQEPCVASQEPHVTGTTVDQHDRRTSAQHHPRPNDEDDSAIPSAKRPRADAAAETNAQPYVTRSGRRCKPPKWLKDMVLTAQLQSDADDAPTRKKFIASVANYWQHDICCIAEATEGHDPASYEEAMASEDAPRWTAAMNTEISALLENKTWELVPRRPSMKVLKNRWVLRIKYNADGSIERYKARLVVKGYMQEHGVDYQEVFAPVVRFESLRLLLALAATLDYEIEQMDVTTAFLNGSIDCDIFMEQPSGFVDRDHEHSVCHLLKSLYGLKQAPKVWYELLRTHLQAHGFHMLQTEACVGVKRCSDGTLCIISIYVDDLLLFARSKSTIDEMKAMLHERFKMKDLGAVHYILGWEVVRNRSQRQLMVTQHKFTQTVLSRFGMDPSHGGTKAIPFPDDLRLSKTLNATTQEEQQLMKGKPYRAVVGSLMYLMLSTRPDIAFAVRECSQFMQNPGIGHWKAAMHILRYLRATQDYGLLLGNGSLNSSLEHHLIGYSDADFANHEDRKSIAGYVTMYGESVISWCSQAERTVALHTTEAEYIAISLLVQEIMHLRMMMNELHLTERSPTKIYADNASAVKLCNNPEFHQRTKHIDVRHHYIREKVQENEITMCPIPTASNTADIFTKPLARIKFCKHRAALRVQDRKSFVAVTQDTSGEALAK